MKLTFHTAGHCRHAMRKMCGQAIEEKRYDIQWGVVNSGNALCAAIFRTKAEAEKYRAEKASAYIVCRVLVAPWYMGEIDL